MTPALPLLVVMIAQASLDDAKERWRAMDLEGAATLLERAVKDARNDDDRCDAWLWLGVVRAEMGDFPAARTSFVSVLRLRPTATLPHGLADVMGEVPPRVRGLFESARLEVEGRKPLRDPRDDPPDHTPDHTPDHAPDRKDRSDHKTGTPDIIADVEGGTRSDEAPPILAVSAIALAGSGVVLLGAAAVVDIAAGPDLLDGGGVSLACMGAGAVLLGAGAALGVAALAE